MSIGMDSKTFPFLLLLLAALISGLRSQTCYRDLVFVVDSSGSIGAGNFEKIKSAFVSTSDAFKCSISTCLQVGVLQYSSPRVFRNPTDLGSCKDVECFKDSVRSRMNFITGETYTADAIRRAVEVNFAASSRANSSNKDLILLTDGKATDSGNLTASYNLTQQHNITVHVVGIGNGVRLKELQQSANGGHSLEGVFLASFDNLTKVIDAILASINLCETTSTTTAETHPGSGKVNLTFMEYDIELFTTPGNFTTKPGSTTHQDATPTTETHSRSAEVNTTVTEYDIELFTPTTPIIRAANATAKPGFHLTQAGGNNGGFVTTTQPLVGMRTILSGFSDNVSCVNVLGLGDGPAKISSKKPTLDEMTRYLNQPRWPTQGDALQNVEIPLLSLLDITTPRSRAVNYTIPMNCSLADITAVTSFSNAATLYNVRIFDARMTCVYIDVKTNKFSTYGMTTYHATTPDYYCASNHTTVFAALLSLQTFTIPSAVGILSYVVEIISVVSLLLTIAILVKVRKRLRSNRTVVQINLSLALLLFHLIFLFGDVALSNPQACKAVAVLSHYFLLASAAWMLLEGITLAQHTFSNNLRTQNPKKDRAMKISLGWGIPAAIEAVACGAGFGTGTYMASTPSLVTQAYSQVNSYSSCWLEPTSLILILCTLLPICIVLLANLIILIRSGVFVFRMSKKRDKFKTSTKRSGNPIQENSVHIHAAFRATLMLMPALGIPWCLSVIQVTEHAFLYWSVAATGLQGFFIFLVYVLLNQEVRRLVARSWNRSSLGNSLRVPESRPETPKPTNNSMPLQP